MQEIRKHNFKNLKIWKDSILLSKEILLLTQNFPKHELYSLTSQINRCSISVPSNIAEGSSRSSEKDFNRFLEISLGSLYELQTQIILAYSLNYIDENTFNKFELSIIELQKMISGFKKTLNK